VPNKKLALRLRYTKTSGGATQEDLKSDRPEPGWQWCIQNAGFEDETSNFTELRIFIQGHGYNHYIEEQDNPLAGHLFTLDREVFLHEGEELVARFTGTSSGDSLAMYLSGYKQKVQDG